MIQKLLPASLLAVAVWSAAPAQAVSSAELYQNESYTYGRFEARIQFAAGDGVVSSFFLWKPGSEIAGTFWNELDFEKLGADCRMQTNPLYGAPVVDHGRIESVSGDLCGDYHTYAFEWTPSYIAWLIDGVEVRREEGEAAAAFELNAASGMQIHFNLWPGDATFGGNFDPMILPVHQYINWVQYSSFESGTFVFDWREDFSTGALPTGWAVGNWPSPKNYSTHAAANVGFESEIAVLSLTADDATGFAGEPPRDETVDGSGGATGGSSGSDSGMAEAGGAAAVNGAGGNAATGGASSGVVGTVSMTGGAGGTTLTAEPSRSRGNSGCSVRAAGSSGAAYWVGLLLAGAVLASVIRGRAAAAGLAPRGRRCRRALASGALKARSRSLDGTPDGTAHSYRSRLLAPHRAWSSGRRVRTA
jgi:endo-1,3-1,4-beta-glycanase ExoK